MYMIGWLVLMAYQPHGLFHAKSCLGLLVGWLVGWVLGYINVCSLFNAKYIFKQIISSISKNSV